jgi:hypothetical protein
LTNKLIQAVTIFEELVAGQGHFTFSEEVLSLFFYLV